MTTNALHCKLQRKLPRVTLSEKNVNLDKFGRTQHLFMGVNPPTQNPRSVPGYVFWEGRGSGVGVHLTRLQQYFWSFIY